MTYNQFTIGTHGRQLFLFLITILFSAVVAPAITVVLDPYAGIDWDKVGHYKANLHAHTTQSDGHLTPTQVIDEYHKRGYSILALTDHNLCTWPWTTLSTMERKGRAFQADRSSNPQAALAGQPTTMDDDEDDEDELPRRRPTRIAPVPPYEDRTPAQLNMIAVPGNEPSKHHHMGVFFIQYETTSRDLEQTIREVGEAGGISMLFHPGRYWKITEDGTLPEAAIDEYVRLFSQYPHLFGMEVINQGQRYKHDIKLWDKILSRMMPERPVWGHANDDMHIAVMLGRDWNVFLLSSLDESQLRDAMLHGRGYFSSISTHDKDQRNVEETPRIRSIRHDIEKGTISVEAISGGNPLPEDQIRWISMGEVVHVGSELPYKTLQGLGTYVRAELIGNGGTTFTNPFGLKE